MPRPAETERNLLGNAGGNGLIDGGISDILMTSVPGAETEQVQAFLSKFAVRKIVDEPIEKIIKKTGRKQQDLRVEMGETA